jgi:CheY-like chemotaxis protein
MKVKLQVLQLEDDLINAKFARLLLEQDGIDCAVTLVATEAEFVAALNAGRFDLILAEYTLPGYNGMMALAMVRERFPALPFIFLTGTMGEEVAINALKQGATYSVLKNRLSRLAPAVRRALLEAEERKVQTKAEESLQLERDLFEMVTTHMSAGLTLISKYFRIIWANESIYRYFGAITGKICRQTSRGQVEVNPDCGVLQVFETGSEQVVCEQEVEASTGETVWVEKIVTPVRDKIGTLMAVLEVALPTTERGRQSTPVVGRGDPRPTHAQDQATTS